MIQRLRSFAVQGINSLLHRSDTVDVENQIGSSGRRVGKVKAWGCRGRRYRTGDEVPHLKNRSTYSVQTDGGWFVNIAGGRIDSWSRHPVHITVADTWGRLGRIVHRKVPRGMR